METNLQEVTLERQCSFWGPVSTILWAVLIGTLSIITGLVTVVVYIAVTIGKISPGQVPAVLKPLQYDGLLLSLSTFASAVVCGLAIIAVVKLKRGSNLREYLGLALPGKRQFFWWFFAIVGFVVLSDGTSLLSGRPIVPEFMLKTYSSSHSHWILWVALLVAAPVYEELFFRGFLIKGLSASALRWYGAVIVSAAVWALVHVQYDVCGIVTIFVLGLILGTARVKSGSIVLTMFLHSFCNLVATTEAASHLRRMFS
jgi:membrane protease YdiL (CAAX protease family)